LVLETGGEVVGIQLSRVKQVIQNGPLFNRAPGRGEFQGVVFHDSKPLSVFGLGEEFANERLIAVVEVEGGTVGISAQVARGVVQPDGLVKIPILDVERMFS
jgi:hypothetical protein